MVLRAKHAYGNLGSSPFLAEAMAQLGQRLATIQLLRDGLYRACEAYANGALDKSSYSMILSRFDDTMITLLLGAEEAGLELLFQGKEWMNASPPEGAMVINCGDMLERLTNHYLPSTIHRVRNPSPERAAFSRYSMPFFLHLRSDFPIRTLPQCITPDNPDRYPDPITADQFLQQRLREIGLKK